IATLCGLARRAATPAPAWLGRLLLIGGRRSVSGRGGLLASYPGSRLFILCFGGRFVLFPLTAGPAARAAARSGGGLVATVAGNLLLLVVRLAERVITLRRIGLGAAEHHAG